MIAYLISSSVTRKQYVGITRRSLRRRWTDHLRAARDNVSTALHAAIRKYGEEAFTIEAIASATSKDDLYHLEALLIVQLRTRAPHGYNLTAGGEGCFGLSLETRERIAAANRGRSHSEAARALISAASKGRVLSASTRAAIGAAHAGKALTAEHKSKLALAKLGKKQPPRSPEHSAKIAKGLRLAHARRRAAANDGILQ